MSKPMKNLKKRLRAPHNLKEAVKRGERLAPAYKADTRITHLRRFSTAIAAYACVAAVLISSVALLPRFLEGSGSPAASVNSMSEDTLIEEMVQIEDDMDYHTGDVHIVKNYMIDSVNGPLSVDISGLPTAPTGDEGSEWLNVAPSAMDDSKKATVIAKKVSAVSYYHTFYSTIEPKMTPLVYTISTFEILSIEQNSDFYHKQPYEVGATIKVIEWYGVAPDETGATEGTLYRSYPYSYQGVAMPDLMEIGKTYRLSLVQGAALDQKDGIIVASCYESGMHRSGLMYLYGCYYVASDVEEIQ